jgi:hypothetical protein
MDLFYLIIVIVALAVFFLDRSHSIIAPPTEPTKKENFTDFPSESLGVDYSAPSPDPEASQGATNIKFGGRPTSAFSKFGPTPPNPRCNITVMGENCSNYNYDTTTNSFQSVCQKSVNTYPNKLFPDYVMGRSLSRVRQCNNLISP